jgi:glycosyltransferase involved in cell wall biosynthesis
MQNIDVIIPALNEEAALPLVLRDIPRPPVRPVVVADNGSTDLPATVAHANGAEVAHEPELSPPTPPTSSSLSTETTATIPASCLG